MSSECPKESATQSVFSTNPPGVVLDKEVLGRILISPEHVDKETGVVKKAAFKKDELKGSGLSVSRLQYVDPDELDARARELAERRPENDYVGIISANVSTIRALKDDGDKRSFCVVDDGLEDYQSHAIIEREGEKSDGAIRKARKRLMDTFTASIRNAADAVAAATGED